MTTQTTVMPGEYEDHKKITVIPISEIMPTVSPVESSVNSSVQSEEGKQATSSKPLEGKTRSDASAVDGGKDDTNVEQDTESEAPKSPKTPKSSKSSRTSKSPSSPRSKKSGKAREKSSSLTPSEVKDIATKLYHEKFVSISPEEYTQFLAAQDADSAAIRERYMGLFDWNPSLIKATRELCSKLYLKGESQEIDRLLSSFTKSYLKQHPVNVFCTQDFEQIYIILYSLILLNTSLHNSEVSKKSKLSQSDYIRNTLATFLQQNKKVSQTLSLKQKVRIERELSFYYEDMSKHELYLKKGDTTEVSRKDQNANRMSVAETILSGYSESTVETAVMSTVTNPSVEMVDLSRRQSNTSTWSMDTEGQRRPSLAMKRISSRTSVGSYTSTTTATSKMTGSNSSKNSRFGFTRALMSDNAYRNSSTPPLRNKSSMDQLRSLARRSSQASVYTTDSISTQRNSVDDTFSLISLGDVPYFDNQGQPGPGRNLENFDIDDFQDPIDLKLELRGAPYLKEGLLKLRILNNDMADQTSPGENSDLTPSPASSVSGSRGGFLSFFTRSKESPSATTLGTSGSSITGSKFTEYFVVVSKGELRLYSFDPKIIKKHQQKMKKSKQQNESDESAQNEELDVGDGNWLNSAANIGNYNLCATTAQIEKNDGSNAASSNKVVLSLTFPRVSKKAPKKFLFEAGTTEVANEFVNTCNFWASKLTAIPTLEESMSSLEYGWSNLDALMRMGDEFKKTKSITKWESLPKGVYLSNLSTQAETDHPNHEGIMKQFVSTIKYYNNLRATYVDFSRKKSEFMRGMRKLSHTANYKLVMQNFDIRSQEYIEDLTKYRKYVSMLGYGLKLRFDLETEEQMVAWAGDILQLPGMETPESIAEEIARRKRIDGDNESDLTKAVKQELKKLMSESNAMKKLCEDTSNDNDHGELKQSSSTKGKVITPEKLEVVTEAPLVKSPKTFSFTNYNGFQTSPVSQLLSAEGLGMKSGASKK